MSRQPALQHAFAALRRADTDAGHAAPTAAHAVELAEAEGDRSAASVAERAWGRALLQCGDVESAIRHLRRSVELAGIVGSRELAGETRIPLAAALLQRGRAEEALAEIDEAVCQLDGVGKARARAQRADLLHQIGRLDHAQAEYETAIASLRRTDDTLNLQRTLVNRGILHTERHSFPAAEADLSEAATLANMLGRHLAAGIIAENLGYLETLRGDVPAALAHLDRAERLIAEQGGQLGPVYSDRAELLLSVGACGEAADAARRAVRAFESEHRRLLVPGARLLLAQIAYLERDWATALEQARRAHREFNRQDRKEWAELARLAVVKTQLAATATTRVAMRRIEATAVTLTAAGWPTAALEAHIVAALVAISRGDHSRSRVHLDAASRTGSRGPAALRARAHYARAVSAWHNGDGAATIRAVRAGLRILDEHTATLGATDLRAHSAAHRVELSELGLRVALRSGRPNRVFEWAERGRANRLANRPLRPPQDPELATLLAELRALHTVSAPLASRLRGRQAVLERRIRDRARLYPGTLDARQTTPVRPAELPLGDSALIEFIQLDGTLYALTVVAGTLRLRPLGAATAAAELGQRLGFALRQLARTNVPTRSRMAARLLLDRAAAAMDAALLRPLPELGDRPLVVVPTGALHSVPWSVLPSCSGRPITVSPSAALWRAAVARRQARLGTVSVAAGPGLAGAHEEATCVAALHRTTPLVHDAATVDAVLKAMTTADVIHLAAHGRIAADQPLLSSLRLYDGPLVAYDLELLDRVPTTVVLASCDTGRSVVCTGDELLGLSATFMALGTAQLIASVVPVPDVETMPLMVEFHKGLVAGRPPAVALADAQQALSGTEAEFLVAAAGFGCFGAGH